MPAAVVGMGLGCRAACGRAGLRRSAGRSVCSHSGATRMVFKTCRGGHGVPKTHPLASSTELPPQPFPYPLPPSAVTKATVYHVLTVSQAMLCAWRASHCLGGTATLGSSNWILSHWMLQRRRPRLERSWSQRQEAGSGVKSRSAGCSRAALMWPVSFTARGLVLGSLASADGDSVGKHQEPG